jgi:acetylornithine deacetylase/succinyl-diaminopimelate desuccinylase-like protein
VYAYSTAAPGSKTVIPCSVKGKFSIRLVPNLTIKSVTDLVVKYVNEEFKKLGSKNRCECVLTHGGEPWMVSSVSYHLCGLLGCNGVMLMPRLTPTTTRTAPLTRQR